MSRPRITTKVVGDPEEVRRLEELLKLVNGGAPADQLGQPAGPVLPCERQSLGPWGDEPETVAEIRRDLCRVARG